MEPAEVMQRYADAARAGDFETAYGLYADDVVFRIPGRSSWAGEHRGREAAIEYIEKARALSEQGDVSRANVYRVRDGEIAEVWISEADQYEVDELMRALQ